MALRSGYKGFKKLLPGLKIIRPGVLGIDNDVLIPELNKVFFTREEESELGAVNILKNNIVSQTLHTTVINVNEDKTVSFENAPNNDLWLNVNNDIRLKAGKYILSGCPAGGSNEKYLLRFVVRNAADTENEKIYYDYGSGVEFEITETTAGRKCVCAIYIKSGQSTDFTYKPMIAFYPGPGKYVQNVMTNKELTGEKWDKTTVLASGDLDDYKTAGMYYWSTNVPSHSPENLTFCKMIVFVGAGSIHQVVLRGNGYVAMRQYDGSEWKSWYKFTSTEITP